MCEIEDAQGDVLNIIPLFMEGFPFETVVMSFPRTSRKVSIGSMLL